MRISRFKEFLLFIQRCTSYHIIGVGKERIINNTLKNIGDCEIFEAITDGEYLRSHQIISFL